VCKIKVGRVKLSSGPHQKRRQIAIFRSGNVTPTKAVWSPQGVISESAKKKHSKTTPKEVKNFEMQRMRPPIRFLGA
jgi:hypothetical protein